MEQSLNRVIGTKAWAVVACGIVLLALLFLVRAPWSPPVAALLQDGRPQGFAGQVPYSGAIALSDPESGWLEIGRYEFGWTLMTPTRLEMHPGEEFSVSCYGRDCLPRFQVRNVGDTEGAIWINGNNTVGSQKGPIRFAIGSFNDGGREIALFQSDGNLVLHHDLLIENQSLRARLATLEERLDALERAQGTLSPSPAVTGDHNP